MTETAVAPAAAEAHNWLARLGPALTDADAAAERFGVHAAGLDAHDVADRLGYEPLSPQRRPRSLSRRLQADPGLRRGGAHPAG